MPPINIVTKKIQSNILAIRLTHRHVLFDNLFLRSSIHTCSPDVKALEAP
ncbi:unnamed protein product, partial [marine sediment metagenome]